MRSFTRAIFGGVLDTNPRTTPTSGAALVKYHQWFACEEAKHLDVSVPDKCMTNLLRFRLSSTNLSVNDQHHILREHRICKLCGSHKVEDELHVVLECRFYRMLREQPRWCHLFDIQDINMPKFMNQKDQYQVAHFISALFAVRKQGLEDRITHNWNAMQLFSSEDEEYECGSQRGTLPVVAHSIL